MNEFLASLDQWALQILMVLYHLMGVQDLPSEASPHWKVVERWSEQPGGHYRLVLESDTIQEECRSGRARYVVFPQTFMAKQEVYAENIRVYTNEMDKEWHLRSLAEKPIIHCDNIIFSKKIIFKINSGIRYFSSINYYPYTLSKYPPEQYLFYYSNLILGILSLSITVVGTIILVVLGEKNINLLGIGISIFLITTSNAPGYLFQIHLHTAHTLIMIGTFLLAFFYIRNKLPDFFSIQRQFVFGGVLILFSFIAFGRSNLMQIILLTCAISTTCLGTAYAVFSSKLKKIDKYSMILVFSVANFDIYRAQAFREGFLNLSFLVLAIVVVELFLIIKKVYTSSIKIKKIQNKLSDQRRFFDMTSNINEKLKEAIHDLKSPITSLNFIVGRRGEISIQQLESVSQRLNSITNKIVSDESVFSANWMPLEVLNSSVLEIADEMSVLFKEIKINFQKNERLLIYLNLDDFKNIISELLNNTFKAGNKKIGQNTVTITSSFDDNLITLIVSDDAGGVSSSLISKLGQKGISTNGSGLGLWMIKQRITYIGGDVQFKNYDKGLGVYISYPIKHLN